jgi:REP element-mobilizing transposase RayT
MSFSAACLAPAMAHPARNARPYAILGSSRVFFATTKTSMGRRLLQSERNAMLLIDVLRLNVAAGKFRLHEFVIMPDHLHLLMTLPGDMTIEKAMQLIKGGFSYRLRREFGYQAEVWERSGNVDCPRSGSVMDKVLCSIANISFRTLSKQGSSRLPSNIPTDTLTWQSKKAQGLKPRPLLSLNGPTKVVP